VGNVADYVCMVTYDMTSQLVFQLFLHPLGFDFCSVCFSVYMYDAYLSQALIDGPCTGVKRKAMSFKQMHLTKFVIKFPHGARSGAVRKAWEKAEVDKQWAETTWAKKIASREQVCILCCNIIIIISGGSDNSRII